jgi:hypothetical protein
MVSFSVLTFLIVCRRPGSSSGKLVVFKTEKLRNLEAEARKKRLEDPAGAPVVSSSGGLEEGKKAAPRSSLPPLKDRRKVANRTDIFEIVEEEEEPAATAAVAAAQ